MTQFGETAQIYRRPADLRSAQVFSDPPINTAGVVKQGDRFSLNETVAWPAEGSRRGLAGRPLHRRHPAPSHQPDGHGPGRRARSAARSW